MRGHGGTCRAANLPPFSGGAAVPTSRRVGADRRSGGTRNPRWVAVGDCMDRYIFPGGELVHMGRSCRPWLMRAWKWSTPKTCAPPLCENPVDWSMRWRAQVASCAADSDGADRYGACAQALRAYSIWPGLPWGLQQGWLGVTSNIADTPQWRFGCRPVRHNRLTPSSVNICTTKEKRHGIHLPIACNRRPDHAEGHRRANSKLLNGL